MKTIEAELQWVIVYRKFRWFGYSSVDNGSNRSWIKTLDAHTTCKQWRFQQWRFLWDSIARAPRINCMRTINTARYNAPAKSVCPDVDPVGSVGRTTIGQKVKIVRKRGSHLLGKLTKDGLSSENILRQILSERTSSLFSGRIVACSAYLVRTSHPTAASSSELRDHNGRWTEQTIFHCVQVLCLT